MRSWSTHALRRTLSRAGSSGANDHPPAPEFFGAWGRDLFLLVRCACVWWWCVCYAMLGRRSRTCGARRVAWGGACVEREEGGEAASGRLSTCIALSGLEVFPHAPSVKRTSYL